MAYRRRHGISRSSTFKDELYRPPDDKTTSSSSSVVSAPTSPLASHPTRASDSHRVSSLSGFANSSFHSSFQRRSKEGGSIVDKKTLDIQETCNKLQNWKAETNHDEFGMQNKNQNHNHNHNHSHSHSHSHNHNHNQNQNHNHNQNQNQSQSQSQSQWQGDKMQSETTTTDHHEHEHEHQLKASRDVAIATAAKAKLLLREIKTVKSDLAFAKQRSCQLEEENKMLREAREKGDHPADDDMIRLQLETLLAEKARLANENSVYIRENSCLRDIIEYHKLSMQDVVYLDEGIEEVAEVNPRVTRTLSAPSLPSPQKK